jgi:hypothetical protein
MKIQKNFAAVLLMVLSFLLFFSVGKATAKNTFKAPDVNMIICLPSFAGSESIFLTPMFTIRNSNNSLAEVRMDYTLEAGDQYLGKSTIPVLYIPPNKTIELKDAIVISFKPWFVSEVFGGKSKKEALMIVAPLWKSLGGKRPAAVPEELWNKLPDKKQTMRVTGSVFVATEGIQEICHFTSEWQDSE